MSELLDWPEFDDAGEGDTYDFVKAEQVLKAMDYLRREAVRTGIEEIVTVVDASFKVAVTAYCMIMRYEMSKLLEKREAQVS